MKSVYILAFILTTMTTVPAYAAGNVPMQCNLSCKTDYDTPASLAVSDDTTESVSVPTPKGITAADVGIPVTTNTGSVEALIAAQQTSTPDSLVVTDTGTSNSGFDYTTECVKYQGKIWQWREGKCTSMSPNWKSPGVGNTLPPQ